MKTIIFSLFLLLSVSTNAQNKATDIIGTWKSQKGDSHITIFNDNGVFYGKVIWGTGGSAKDVNNPDASLRNRDVVGLVILKGFRFDGKYEWEGGTIYDPRNGETYDCVMSLKDGNTLNIRGYVGMSLFGRTEVWTRIKS